MAASPSPSATRIDRPSDYHDTRRAMDVARSPKRGTFVGGTAVTGRRVLCDGDEIRVGPVALIFSVAPATKATETMRQS